MSKTIKDIQSEYWKPLEQAQLQYKNGLVSQKEELIALLIEAFQPYKHIKRINKRQTDAIEEQLKDNRVGFRHAQVAPKEWFPGFKLTFWYSRKQWDFRKKDYTTEYTYETNNMENASGEEIIKVLEARLKQVKEWDYKEKYRPVEEYEKFYLEVELLAEKHKCGEDALKLFRYYS